MKVLVTGATGFIGSRVVPRLIAQGHAITALVRRTSKVENLTRQGVGLAYGDVTDAASLVAAARGQEALVHLAAWYEFGIDDGDRMQAINVGGTRNALAAAREARLTRIVYVSSIVGMGESGSGTASETTPHPGTCHSHYERTKRQAQEEAERAMKDGLPVIVLCPGAVYGPRDTSSVGTMVEGFLAGKVLAMICPESKLTYVYVEDVADGIVAAFERGKPGERYLLGNVVATGREMFDVLARLTGRSAPRLSLNGPLARLAVKIEGLRAAVMGGKPLINPEIYAMMEGVHWAFDSSKAMRDLDWKPRPLEVGMRETLEAMGALAGPRP